MGAVASPASDWGSPSSPDETCAHRALSHSEVSGTGGAGRGQVSGGLGEGVHGERACDGDVSEMVRVLTV